MGLSIIVFITSSLILVLSGSLIVKSLTRLAVSLRSSFFVLGFILMAFATTIPELMVGIDSALEKNPSLSLGNVLGSNIANLGFILALAAIYNKFLGRKSGIKSKSKNISRDIIYLIPITLISFILLLDRTLSQIDGLVLVGTFIIYLGILIRERREFQSIIKEGPLLSGCLSNFLLLIFSISLLIVSANFVVDYGMLIAASFKIPTLLIGLSGVALGTSLPELVFTIRAVKENKDEMALGDLVGACAINSTLVLGVTALIYPITDIDLLALFKAVLFLMVMLFIFAAKIRSKDGLSWPAGIILLVLYISFLWLEFVNHY